MFITREDSKEVGLLSYIYYTIYLLILKTLSIFAQKYKASMLY